MAAVGPRPTSVTEIGPITPGGFSTAFTEGMGSSFGQLVPGAIGGLMNLGIDMIGAEEQMRRQKNWALRGPSIQLAGLRKAGLNPLLMFGRGGFSPGQMTVQQTHGSQGAQYAGNAMAAKKVNAEMDAIRSVINRNISEAQAANARRNLNQAQAATEYWRKKQAEYDAALTLAGIPAANARWKVDSSDYGQGMLKTARGAELLGGVTSPVVGGLIGANRAATAAQLLRSKGAK